MNKEYDADVYKLDGAKYYKKLTKQYNGFFSRLFSSEYKRIISDLQLCRKDGKKPKYTLAVDILKTLNVYQEKQLEFCNIEKNIQNLLGSAYKGINTDFCKLIDELTALCDIQSTEISFGTLSSATLPTFNAEQNNFAQIANTYNTIYSKYEDCIKHITSSFNENDYDVQSVTMQSLITKCNGCIENIDNVNYWYEFSKLLQNLEELELRTFIDYCINKQIPTEQIIATFKKAFYVQWIYAILQDSPVLNTLTRASHDDIVKRFKEKDKLNFDINKAKIKAKLSAQRPTLDMVAPGSSIAMLLRENEKKRKQKSIRSLLAQIGDLAQTLKPCFLMSPLSVSTFLNPDVKFDVVIFDEASQIFPQDAIGAIYRGKQLIVVGDSKQMPPSNFFNSVVESDNDDEDEDITDFESILDLCSTTFPQCRLKWHYRSRYEELISFSNKNFYENDLVTFPSSQTNKVGIGVDFFHVNGTFDRKSKTNRAEAEKIVDLVFENIEKYPERSLGIVAFSISQQNLIDKLISSRRQSDPSKEPFFSSNKKEPFFVKNLETVQGDERDTIIFSIAYGQDSQGRLLLNFGPINKNGGERRLNVAVTRAKYNIQLVSSMYATDIDLSRVNSVGAKLLREYLDYAENGTIALERSVNVNSYDQFDSEFELEVCEFLRENGFCVDTQVGCSSFKIDLGLKKPNSSNYVLAIECDGATYHSSKTARDRDRLRQDILEQMGWRFYRIWSTDWFKNKKAEKERLLNAAKDAIENAPIDRQEQTQEIINFEQTITIKPFEFPKYIQVDERAIALKLHQYNVFLSIINTETPISEEWLLKRTAFLFGREKVTAVVRNQFNYYILPYLKQHDVISHNGFLYIKDSKTPMLRVPNGKDAPRDIKYIDDNELALGLKELIKQNVVAEKVGLFKLLAKQLGFARIGDSIMAKMENALNLISHDIEINYTETNEQTLSIKS